MLPLLANKDEYIFDLPAINDLLTYLLV